MQKLIKKVSKGTRFNQIYIKKDEGSNFLPGSNVVITPIEDLISAEVFEHNTTLNSTKKDIIKQIFKIINCDCIITGSFLDKGFNFEDIDIIVLNKIKKKQVASLIEQSVGIKPHLILIDEKTLNKGIKRDPMFRLMIDRYVSSKKMIFNKNKKIDYKLLDIYLIKNKNLIDGYDLFNINQRKKLLRDFISIKLFAENKNLTIHNVEKETSKIFGKDIIEKLFYYGDNKAKQEFIRKLKKQFHKLQEKILQNAAK